MLDMIATSVNSYLIYCEFKLLKFVKFSFQTMYIGLNLTYASSFQMLRGSVIVFVAIFSMIFLQKKLLLREWTGIAFIIIGLTAVGLSDIMGSSTGKDANRTDILIGDSLIILAQIITASQMVFEEKFVAGLDIPALQAVGWEGFFGFFVLSSLLVPMYFVAAPGGDPNKRVEDAIDAFYMIKHNNLLLVPICGTIVSIAFFNFAGISVTKEMSATTRMVITEKYFIFFI
jgi:drug/metabolite transporter (DMT)-like permease